ncbi:hypothetical protein A5N15_05560, partial [Rothia kristinae]
HGESAAGRHRGEQAERGAVGVLALGLCVILLLLSVTVMAVSSVYIEQRKLQLLADQCADAATTRVAGFDADGAQSGVMLDPGQVTTATQEVIGGVGHGVDAVAIAPGTGAVDASTARVELTGASPPAAGRVGRARRGADPGREQRPSGAHPLSRRSGARGQLSGSGELVPARRRQIPVRSDGDGRW